MSAEERGRIRFLEERTEKAEATLRQWQRENVQQADDLTEANNLLKQTIEVLRDFNTKWFAPADYAAWDWWEEQAKPLLDNLKALKKEGTE